MTINISIQDLFYSIKSIKSIEEEVKIISTPAGDILQLGETLVGEQWIIGDDYCLSWASDFENADYFRIDLCVDDGWGGKNHFDWELRLKPQGWVSTFKNSRNSPDSQVYASIKEALDQEYFEKARLMSVACSISQSMTKDRIVWQEF